MRYISIHHLQINRPRQLLLSQTYPTSCTIDTLKGGRITLVPFPLLRLETCGFPRFAVFFTNVDDNSSGISFKVTTLNGFLQNFIILTGTLSEYTSITFPGLNPKELGESKSSITFPSNMKSNESLSLRIYQDI